MTDRPEIFTTGQFVFVHKPLQGQRMPHRLNALVNYDDGERITVVYCNGEFQTLSPQQRKIVEAVRHD